MKSLIIGLRSHCCKLCWKKATSLVCENRTNHLAPTLCILHRPTDQHFYRKNVFPSFVDSNQVLNNYIKYIRFTCWSHGRFLSSWRRVQWRSLNPMLCIWNRLRSVMGKQRHTIWQQWNNMHYKRGTERKSSHASYFVSLIAKNWTYINYEYSQRPELDFWSYYLKILLEQIDVFVKELMITFISYSSF